VGDLKQMNAECLRGVSIAGYRATAQEAPVNASWLTLDADGTALPTDWYLRVAAETARVLRGEATLQNVFPLLDGASGTAPCEPPHTVDVGGQCVPSCGHAGGTCGPQGSACSGELVTSYDCAVCCKTTTAPAPTCNPPHSILVNGQCVPSCGHAGGTCGPQGSACSGELVTSYDCAVCCKP
jgi:hypothetical protein